MKSGGSWPASRIIPLGTRLAESNCTDDTWSFTKVGLHGECLSSFVKPRTAKWDVIHWSIRSRCWIKNNARLESSVVTLLFVECSEKLSNSVIWPPVMPGVKGPNLERAILFWLYPRRRSSKREGGASDSFKVNTTNSRNCGSRAGYFLNGSRRKQRVNTNT